MSLAAESHKAHRSLRTWLVANTVVLIGVGVLVALDHESFVSWLVLLGAFGNFMSTLLHWRARSPAG